MGKDWGTSCLEPHWKADSSLIRDLNCIPARAVNIVWGNCPRYWNWIEMKEEEKNKTQMTGSDEAALLLQINWLAVTGKIDMKLLEAANTYTVYYVVKFHVDAFGWHSDPVQFQVRVTGKEYVHKTAKLEQYRLRPGEWHEVPGGEFTVPSDEDVAGGGVEFGMFEVNSEFWKGSMVLAGVKIKPSPEKKAVQIV